VVLARLDRFNRRHPWSHNDHYGPWVVRQVAGARHVLDVGCGTGNLVARLRRRATTVTGLEPDPATARVAEERFADDPAVTIVRTGFAGRDPQRRWDAVTLVAVLHHLPLVPTLRELRGCLAPGGRLVVVGCYREAGPVDLLAALPAVVANPVMGLVRHPARADAPPPHMTAPTADPAETLVDIRAAAARELPGARIRRRLFWRYTLVYDAAVT
jgi:SAM-dependent methyltransferase